MTDAAPLRSESVQWTSSAEFVANIKPVQADPELAAVLTLLDAETDDLGPIR